MPSDGTASAGMDGENGLAATTYCTLSTPVRASRLLMSSHLDLMSLILSAKPFAATICRACSMIVEHSMPITCRAGNDPGVRNMRLFDASVDQGTHSRREALPRMPKSKYTVTLYVAVRK